MEDKNIKSIVISGGGHTFVTFYGVIKNQKKRDFGILKTLNLYMELLLGQ